ncbi:MAG: hypothetical protein KY475_13390 [Planctomycetes bacterium]|nr:hypothetical protein [Planctomycetota bacterium]
MSVFSVASFAPVGSNDYLDRLGVLPPQPDFPPKVWTAVHHAVQEELAALEVAVRRKTPQLSVRRGHTTGESFFLFSYVSFSTSDPARDPVVAGVTFTPTERGVTLEADVSGEQSGDYVASSRIETVAGDNDELLATARELTRYLCQSAEAIAAAINEPSSQVE